MDLSENSSDTPVYTGGRIVGGIMLRVTGITSVERFLRLEQKTHGLDVDQIFREIKAMKFSPYRMFLEIALNNLLEAQEIVVLA
jgi:hypothetical protein